MGLPESLINLVASEASSTLTWLVVLVTLGVTIWDRRARRLRTVGSAEAELREDLFAELRQLREERKEQDKKIATLREELGVERAKRIALESEVARLMARLDQ